MEWIIAYLASVIVVPFFFAIFWCDRNENKVEINGGDSAGNVLGFCLLWFIFVPTIVIQKIRSTRKEYYINTAKSILRDHHIDRMSYHDRSDLTVVPEWALKFLLKNFRKKRIELDTKTVEIVREELMNRNAEKHLLR